MRALPCLGRHAIETLAIIVDTTQIATVATVIWWPTSLEGTDIVSRRRIEDDKRHTRRKAWPANADAFIIGLLDTHATTALTITFTPNRAPRLARIVDTSHARLALEVAKRPAATCAFSLSDTVSPAPRSHDTPG